MGAYGDRGYGDGFKQGLGEKRAGGDQEGKGSRGKGHGPGGLCRETAGAAPFSPENLFSQSFFRSEQRGQEQSGQTICWLIFLLKIQDGDKGHWVSFLSTKDLTPLTSLEDVLEPMLSFRGPSYLCHERMRRAISSFEMTRPASESASPRSTMT